MSKYTPGNWRVDSEDPFAIIDEDGSGIAHVYNEPAEVKALMDMMKDYARLIAAAPEMLEACKALASAWGKNYPNAEEAFKKTDRAYELAKKAIAKIEGGPTT